MSENRIRKTDTKQVHGPASAGIWVAKSTNSPKYNPDGTARELAPIILNVDGVTSATTSKYVWVAPVAMQIVGLRATFSTGSTSGTVKAVKGAAGTAVASGTDMTATAALSGTANTPTSAAPHATVANTKVAAGEQIGLVFAGTMTSLAGGVVTLFFRQI